MKTKYFNIQRDKHNILCKLFTQDNRVIKDVVIYGHGFAGHKDTKTAERLAEKVISKNKGFAVLVFDLPCHGEDVKKKMVLEDCITYYSFVIDYAKETIGAEKLYGNSTSFGCFLMLKYISELGNPFEKIVLRSPAIKMYEIVARSLVNDEMKDTLKKGKEVQIGFDRKVSISQQFLDDLKASDISERDFMDFADDILVLHGTKDEVAPFSDAEEFCDKNVIEFIPVENADHRYSELKKLEYAHVKTLEFFGL